MTKEEQIESLVSKAVCYGLSGSEGLACTPIKDLVAQYNGVGPEWLNSRLPDVAKRVTDYCSIIEPAILIHDWRFSKSDGTRQSFNLANMELRDNINKIARIQYPSMILSKQWWRIRATGRLFFDACNDFGWTAWIDGWER